MAVAPFSLYCNAQNGELRGYLQRKQRTAAMRKVNFTDRIVSNFLRRSTRVWLVVAGAAPDQNGDRSGDLREGNGG